ncbi:13785_t:CDS:2, partial [Cetraspora pellucida]
QELQYLTEIEYKLRQELYSKINSIPQYQLSRAIYMLNNMIYTKGKHQGELISEYYQKKILKFLEKFLYKHESDAISLTQKIKQLESKNRKLQKELEESKEQIKSLKITVTSIKNLPAGYRAYEMPNAVLKWIKDIKNAQENITELFEEELKEANSCLNVEEYQNLYVSLKSGLKNAYEGFCKWMTPWIHLPLLVCALGGSNGSLFASAFLKVYTNTKLQES